MNIKNNKKDNEVYILGSEGGNSPKRKMSASRWAVLIVLCLLIIGGGLFLYLTPREETTTDYYFEPEGITEQSISVTTTDTLKSNVEKGYIEVVQESINDVPLTLYIPHGASMSLTVGMPDRNDPSLIFAAMAADIRRDNKQIVGDFVLSGQRLARGVAKKGFCAIEGNKITIGVGESTPLLQQVLESGGSFFRQYPLVNNGELVENRPKNKSIRRALAVRNDRVMMVESENKESFHDFSQALIDIGVTDAIYLVGGDAYGWYYKDENTRQDFGELKPDLPENISYIVWKTTE